MLISLFFYLFNSCLFAQQSSVEKIRDFVYPIDNSEERLYFHYNGGAYPVDMQTIKYIEPLGENNDGEYLFDVTSIMQMNEGKLRGTMATSRVIIKSDGLHLQREKFENSYLGINETKRYSHEPVLFKLPKAQSKAQWTYVSNGNTVRATAEYTILTIDNKDYRAIRVTEIIYDTKGHIVVEPMDSYYLKGVGLFRVTFGKQSKLYMRLANSDYYLSKAETIEKEDEQNMPIKATIEEKNRPKAIMPKNNKY